MVCREDCNAPIALTGMFSGLRYSAKLRNAGKLSIFSSVACRFWKIVMCPLQDGYIRDHFDAERQARETHRR